MCNFGTFSGMTGDLPDDDAVVEQASEVLREAQRLGDERGVDTDRADPSV
jgi:hypothetical protein